jgi:hypothetical protein
LEYVSDFYRSIKEILDDFNNNKSNKMLGVFDMFDFCADYLLFSDTGVVSEEKAVKKFMDFLEFDLFLTQAVTVDTVVKQLVVGYRIFLKFFGNAISLFKEMAAVYYYDFSNRLNGTNSLLANEALMKSITESLDFEARTSLKSFHNYRNRCDTNMYGLLMENGRYVFSTEKGFLHEFGVWIKPKTDGGVSFNMVDVSDNFDRMLEGAIYNADNR